ncbi:MAG: zinc-dependent alcohol dehydrogenase family protein [Methylovirgula sp.]
MDRGIFRLHRETVAFPDPRDRQVLIKVSAASLNYRDLLTMNDPTTKAGLVPLSDAAGAVIATGENVTRWKSGDRVCPNFFPAWLDGRFSTDYLSQTLGGGQTDGVLSELVLADEASLTAIPENLTFNEAATLPCAGVTAWHALFERGAVQSGATVLVQGTGGVAMFAFQLATAAGAKVIVTSSSDDKLRHAEALGAWRTINYRSRPNWDETALEYTDGKGVDYILELGGADTYERSISAIAAGGYIAQIGVLSGFAALPNIRPLQFKNADIHGICVGSAAQFQRLADFVQKHNIRPVIDRVFDFAEAPSAYEYLKSAKHLGKVIISVS